MRTLHEIHVKGFKSIRDQRLELGPLNVFIGGNGAGKSNLVGVGVFHLLRRLSMGELQVYTGETGGADALLHFGRKRTPALTMHLEFLEGPCANIYDLSLVPTADDRFVFKWESAEYYEAEDAVPQAGFAGPRGHAEARVSTDDPPAARYVREDLSNYRIYHFHDTSSSASVKQTGHLADNRFLREDAANLAAFLYRLQQTHPDHFRNIEDTIRQIAPFFRGFKLEPDALAADRIRLEWGEVGGGDAYFNASVLSDGTLRFMCLATLLLQPDLPPLILIDEPELGLHPAAIHVLAGLLESASTACQIIVATQSVTLVNHLRPEQVWAVDREGGESVFRHLKSEDMATWLDDYALGELWEKNVFGGRP